MNKLLAVGTNETSSQIELNWQRRLDALVSGDCSEDDFMDEFSGLREAVPDSAWDVFALLDQRFRRGQMSVELFRSIESKITQSEFETVDCPTTINLHHSIPAFEPSTESISDPVKGEIPPNQGGIDIGRVLRDRYVLESRLGSGGMGAVFKVMDRYRCDLPPENRHLAIKVLHEKINSRPEVWSNLRREFFSAQALSHCNIVKVYELDRDGDVAFFTMELLEGELLSRVIGRLNPGAMNRTDAWSIILQVGAGLTHAHTRNVVHGDLKPQNIMLTKSGEVRILDFGASIGATRQLADNEKSHRPKSQLTPAYACCERLEGQQADPRDDLYALACVTYELLAGEHPFQGHRSTEARKLGLKPRRPPNLTAQQWQTLTMGLSWGRQDRSIAVRDWIAELQPRPQTAARIVRSWDLKSEPRSRASSSRTVVLITVLAASLIVWFSLNRSTVEGKINTDVAVPKVVETAAIRTDPLALGLQDVPSKEELTQAMQPEMALPKIVLRDAARSATTVAGRNKISFSADTYRIPSREKFAEIHVRRSAGSDADTSFVWWTEPSSAKPGSDYIPQARVTQLFPKGKLTASLFVKIIPNVSRKNPTVFYVDLVNPSNGSSVGRARTAILLPSSR